MPLMTGYSRQSASEMAPDERERLILEQIPQVHFIAARIHERLPKHIAVDDLVSAGMLGLIAAVDNYDPARNVKLCTYAEHKIRGYILNSTSKLSGASRQSVKLRRDVQRAIGQAERKHGGAASAEAVAAELGVSLEEYHAMLSELQATNLGSLEPTNAAGEGSAIRYVADPSGDTPERTVVMAELRALVIESVGKLPDNERIVLSFYYLEGLSLREIAEIMDLHITRISQLKTQAILRLRTHIEKLWPGRVDL
jgi:RNA polymerase sigma factor for flagellar operon FliA